MRNKHGLPRYIPDHIRREVRKRCGFGCVICGEAFVQYDHMDPPFAEATEHLAHCITLLCIKHHGLKTKHLIADAAVIAANDKPKCLSEGFIRGPLFFMGDQVPDITLGPLDCSNMLTVLEMYGERILYFEPPDEAGSPYLLNALMRNRVGDIVLEIKNNEWRTSTENWDVIDQANRVSILNDKGDLAIEFESDGQTFRFTRLNMVYRDWQIKFSPKESLVLVSPGGERKITCGAAHFDGYEAAIRIRNGEIIIGAGGGTLTLGSGSNAGISLSMATAAAPVPTKVSLTLLPPRQDAPCPCRSGASFRNCHGRSGSGTKKA